jgi:hypothetical protein
LEETGCVGGDTGWTPRHLTLWRDGRLAAIAPLYEKTHSWGEFVFDQEWANAATRLGLDYYPKLLGMSPFTPAVGYRFMFAAGIDREDAGKSLMAAIDAFCLERGVSGCHFLHVDPEFADFLERLGAGKWLHHALVWENEGFSDFGDYLGSFRQKQRKNIKAERKKLAADQLRLTVREGVDCGPEDFDMAFAFYCDTCLRHWGGSQYLNLEFFRRLGLRYRHRPVLVTASLPGLETPVAMSLLLRKNDWLYGRYWGSRADFSGLHFEVCYYSAIEWAIERGVRFYDAGSGSAKHKRRRGFPARAKYSLHKFYQPVMKALWLGNIDHINEMEQAQIDYINGERQIV